MKELEKIELIEIDGGTFEIPKWIKGSIWFMIGVYVIDNWPDIKAGIVDGFTDGANSN